MNKKIVLLKFFALVKLFSVLLLAVLLFAGCPQPQNSEWEETPVFPETPQNLRVSPGNNRLIVSWDSARGAASYELLWSAEGGPEQSKESNATTVILNGLGNGKVYWIRIRSKNSAGVSAFSSPVEAKPELRAPAPSLVRGNLELSVGWAAEEGVEYEVWYGTTDNFADAGQWNGVIDGSGIVAGTTITGLINGDTYYVWIKTQEVTGEFSQETPESPFNPPQGFVYVSGGTVAGSVGYSMTMMVPHDPVYMNAGSFRTMLGVFVEGRTAAIESFFMAKNTITRELWFEVQSWADSNGYFFQNRISAPTDSNRNRPVTGISWRDAIVWCNAYSEKSGLQPVYYSGGSVLRDSRNANGTAVDNAVMDKSRNGFRLPTEVEREFAARGGDPGKAAWMYSFAGSNNADDVAWHHGNSPFEVRDVGLKKPNRLGIYDLSGNVMEWGWGWMYWNVAVTPQTPVDGEPRGSPFSQKPMAGGAARSNITMSVVADRWGMGPAFTEAFVGFRVKRRAE